jgi:hypothetical protein
MAYKQHQTFTKSLSSDNKTLHKFSQFFGAHICSLNIQLILSRAHLNYLKFVNYTKDPKNTFTREL